jgi:hypothetical protein
MRINHDLAAVGSSAAGQFGYSYDGDIREETNCNISKKTSSLL